jgi:hypothetical protein
VFAQHDLRGGGKLVEENEKNPVSRNDCIEEGKENCVLGKVNYHHWKMLLLKLVEVVVNRCYSDSSLRSE